MPDDKKQKLTIGAYTVEVTPLEIVHRREQPNEYELEDGTIIRVVNPTVIVYRIEGQRDYEGHPAYWVKNGTSVIVVRGSRESTKNGGGA